MWQEQGNYNETDKNRWGSWRGKNEEGKSVDLIENLGLYNGYGIGTQKKVLHGLILMIQS